VFCDGSGEIHRDEWTPQRLPQEGYSACQLSTASMNRDMRRCGQIHPELD